MIQEGNETDNTKLQKDLSDMRVNADENIAC